MTAKKLSIALLSDTHCQHDKVKVPKADMVIHAGDFSGWGTEREALHFAHWFKNLPHKYKVLIPGNHDKFAETPYGYPILKQMLGPDVVFLDNQGVELAGHVIWGSPWTPTFGRDWAFNADRGAAIKRHWDHIPDDTTILITHGPPYGILDHTWANYDDPLDQELVHVGCEDLRTRVFELAHLQLHVFGHIHTAYGQQTREFGESGALFVNAAVTDTTRQGYHVTRSPILVNI
jgi:Icc-related predicted phosphoesterase